MLQKCLIGQLEGVTKVLKDNKHNIWEKHTRNLHTKKVSKEKSICLSRLLQYAGQTLLGKYETTVRIKKPPWTSSLPLSIYQRRGWRSGDSWCCLFFTIVQPPTVAIVWSANIGTILIIVKRWYWHAYDYFEVPILARLWSFWSFGIGTLVAYEHSKVLKPIPLLFLSPLLSM